MAQTTEEQKHSYPLPVYNFRVTVDGVAMSFAEVSGIQVEYDSVTYRHGLSFLDGERISTFYFDAFIPVTLKRGTVLNERLLWLYKWMQQRESRRLEVSLCDEEGTPVFSWVIAVAVPIKLEAPTFDAKSQEVAIESLELKARGISVVEL